MKESVFKHIGTYIIFLCFLGVHSNEILAQEEEKPYRIWNVNIEGNKEYTDIVIKNYIANEAPSLWDKLTFFNEKGFYVSENEILRDIIRIERFYQRRGFPEVDVTYRLDTKNKDWKKRLVFEVKENAPVRIDSVQLVTKISAKDSAVIFGSESFSKKLNRIPYRKGKIYQPILRTDVESEISGALRNLGYPYAYTEIQSKVDTLSKKAEIVILSYPGVRARFHSLLVEGEETFSSDLIRRETGIQTGDYFNDNDMRTAQKELFNHHLLRFAIISIPDQEQDSTLNVLLRVRERKLRSAQLTFGAGNFDRIDEEFSLTTGLKLLRAQGSWTHRNVRSKGEQITLNAKASFFDMRVGANYLFPYIYNTKSSITISPFVQRRDENSYKIATGGIRNSFGYNYSQSLTGTFSYDFTLNREFDVKQAPDGTSLVSPDSVLNYNVSSFKVNFFASQGIPRGGNGFSIQPFLELSGLFNEATFSFQKASVDIRGFKRVTRGLVVAARTQLGSIYYSKQDSLPADIRFYSGGSSDVRGWNRQELGPKEAVFDSLGSFSGYVPIGGKAQFSFNFELRQDVRRILKGLSLAAFLDGGQVWRTTKRTDERPVQFGLGGGIRYDSPIGPIRVDLAYKLNPTDPDLNIYQGDRSKSSAWDRWGIHFSIGQAF